MSLVEKKLQEHPTFIITKPGCIFCKYAINLMNEKKIEFKEINGPENPDLVKEVMVSNSYKTFPMIFFEKKFIGGYDNFKEVMDNTENKKNL